MLDVAESRRGQADSAGSAGRGKQPLVASAAAAGCPTLSGVALCRCGQAHGLEVPAHLVVHCRAGQQGSRAGKKEWCQVGAGQVGLVAEAVLGTAASNRRVPGPEAEQQGGGLGQARCRQGMEQRRRTRLGHPWEDGFEVELQGGGRKARRRSAKKAHTQAGAGPATSVLPGGRMQAGTCGSKGCRVAEAGAQGVAGQAQVCTHCMQGQGARAAEPPRQGHTPAGRGAGGRACGGKGRRSARQRAAGTAACQCCCQGHAAGSAASSCKAPPAPPLSAPAGHAGRVGGWWGQGSAAVSAAVAAAACAEVLRLPRHPQRLGVAAWPHTRHRTSHTRRQHGRQRSGGGNRDAPPPSTRQLNHPAPTSPTNNPAPTHPPASAPSTHLVQQDVPHKLPHGDGAPQARGGGLKLLHSAAHRGSRQQAGMGRGRVKRAAWGGGLLHVGWVEEQQRHLSPHCPFQCGSSSSSRCCQPADVSSAGRLAPRHANPSRCRRST